MNIIYMTNTTIIIKVRKMKIKSKTQDGKIINKSFIEYASKNIVHICLKLDITDLKRIVTTFLANDSV